MRDGTEPDGTKRTHRFGRRNLLRAVGAGAALSTAGVVGAQTTEAPAEETASSGEETATSVGGGTDGGAGGAFGFPAVSGDVAPPAQPDHTVELHVRPREGSEIPEFFFEPTGLAIEPGDTVKFDYVTPHHTVTAYHPAFGYQSRVPEGTPPFSSPVLPAGGYWLYTFEREGVYDYHCGPHEAFGHVGRVVCGSAEGFEPLPDLCAGQEQSAENETEGSEGGEGGEEGRLPFLTAHTVLSDPALDPENVLERGSVSWEAIAPENKQLFVEVQGFPPCGDGC